MRGTELSNIFYFNFQVLNERTIPNIKARIVCGAANNQLGKPDDNKIMAEMGITYVVDFLCNRMVMYLSI